MTTALDTLVAGGSVELIFSLSAIGPDSSGHRSTRCWPMPASRWSRSAAVSARELLRRTLCADRADRADRPNADLSMRGTLRCAAAATAPAKPLPPP
jgi:hypothetical protein